MEGSSKHWEVLDLTETISSSDDPTNSATISNEKDLPKSKAALSAVIAKAKKIGAKSKRPKATPNKVVEPLKNKDAPQKPNKVIKKKHAPKASKASKSTDVWNTPNKMPASEKEQGVPKGPEPNINKPGHRVESLAEGSKSGKPLDSNSLLKELDAEETLQEFFEFLNGKVSAAKAAKKSVNLEAMQQMEEVTIAKENFHMAVKRVNQAEGLLKSALQEIEAAHHEVGLAARQLRRAERRDNKKSD